MQTLKLATLLIPVLAAGLSTLPSTAGAKDKDKDLACAALYGPFTSQTGEPCDSPVGLCTHGLLEGELEATYDFTFLTLEPANDPTDPTKFVYTGVSVVTAIDGSGTLYTDDTGVVHIPTDNSPASFVTKAVIVEGTDAYKKTVGGFVATGTLIFSSGAAEGTYSAVLCAPEKKH
jgi:hypothetical protein